MNKPENRIEVYRSGNLIGYAYQYQDRYVAQLNPDISIRSQSFNTLERAIKALQEFDPSQLPFDTLDHTIQLMKFIDQKLF